MIDVVPLRGFSFVKNEFLKFKDVTIRSFLVLGKIKSQKYYLKTSSNLNLKII